MLITMKKVPFDFHRSRTNVLTIRDMGTHDVADDLGEAAVAKGYATAEPVAAPKAKAKPKAKSTLKPKTAKPAVNAAPDTPGPDGVDGTDLAADGGADAVEPLAAPQ